MPRGSSSGGEHPSADGRQRPATAGVTEALGTESTACSWVLAYQRPEAKKALKESAVELPARPEADQGQGLHASRQGRAWPGWGGEASVRWLLWGCRQCLGSVHSPCTRGHSSTHPSLTTRPPHPHTRTHRPPARSKTTSSGQQEWGGRDRMAWGREEGGKGERSSSSAYKGEIPQGEPTDRCL